MLFHPVYKSIWLWQNKSFQKILKRSVFRDTLSKVLCLTYGYRIVFLEYISSDCSTYIVLVKLVWLTDFVMSRLMAKWRNLKYECPIFLTAYTYLLSTLAECTFREILFYYWPPKKRIIRRLIWLVLHQICVALFYAVRGLGKKTFNSNMLFNLTGQPQHLEATVQRR